MKTCCVYSHVLKCNSIVCLETRERSDDILKIQMRNPIGISSRKGNNPSTCMEARAPSNCKIITWSNKVRCHFILKLTSLSPNKDILAFCHPTKVVKFKCEKGLSAPTTPVGNKTLWSIRGKETSHRWKKLFILPTDFNVLPRFEKCATFLHSFFASWICIFVGISNSL